jgi:hypothetical protein
LVDGRDRRVLSETICFPAWGERHYDEEGKDRVRDQGKEGGLGEGVYVVPFIGGGQTKFSRERVEDFGVVFWKAVRTRRVMGKGSEPRTVKVFMPLIISALGAIVGFLGDTEREL